MHVVSRAGRLVGATDVVSVGCASLRQRCVGFGAPLGLLKGVSSVWSRASGP